jgi:iron complex transport system ATP-binding protein
MTDTTSALLRTEDLSVSIGDTHICHGLNLEIKRGQCWGILGRNGAGKTTLMHTLAGLRNSDSGRIHLEDTPMDSLSRKQIAQTLGILFQQGFDDPFPGTVLERALLGRHPHLGRWQWEDTDDIHTAKQALSELALEKHLERQITTLSGGERQRLAIATLLTQSPQLFLLDEPTNHLDIHHQVTVLAMLNDIAKTQQKGLVMILHDINLAARYCDHILLLFGNGQCLQGPTEEVLTEANLEALYQHQIHAINTPHGSAFLPG